MNEKLVEQVARPDHDDLLLMDYIKQRAMLDQIERTPDEG